MQQRLPGHYFHLGRDQVLSLVFGLVRAEDQNLSEVLYLAYLQGLFFALVILEVDVTEASGVACELVVDHKGLSASP